LKISIIFDTLWNLTDTTVDITLVIEQTKRKW